MTSRIEICNLALSNVRANEINSLDENSREAQVCRARYQRAVNFCLAGANWSFARKTVALAQLDINPPEWVYAYALPTDSIRLRYLVPLRNIDGERTLLFREEYRDVQKFDIPFERGIFGPNNTQVIYTDVDEACMVYTAELDDANLFDEMFIDAVSWWLGSMIAVPIIGESKGADLRDSAARMYGNIITAAIAANGAEAKEYPPEDAQVVKARHSGQGQYSSDY